MSQIAVIKKQDLKQEKSLDKTHNDLDEFFHIFKMEIVALKPLNMRISQHLFFE